MTEQALARACERIATSYALSYLRVHHLHVDNARLAECLNARIKARLPEAIRDAKDAFQIPGMERIGEATFAASMMQAGIEAAKKAAR